LIVDPFAYILLLRPFARAELQAQQREQKWISLNGSLSTKVAQLQSDLEAERKRTAVLQADLAAKACFVCSPKDSHASAFSCIILTLCSDLPASPRSRSSSASRPNALSLPHRPMRCEWRKSSLPAVPSRNASSSATSTSRRPAELRHLRRDERSFDSLSGYVLCFGDVVGCWVSATHYEKPSIRSASSMKRRYDKWPRRKIKSWTRSDRK